MFLLSFFERKAKSGMEVHACNVGTPEWRQEDHDFVTNLRYYIKSKSNPSIHQERKKGRKIKRKKITHSKNRPRTLRENSQMEKKSGNNVNVI